MEIIMKKTLILVASGAALASVPAMAQDRSTFTGPRVEAVVGYDVSKAGSSVDDDANVENDQSIDGFVYGIGAGYDFDLGGVVVGAEAELTASSAKTEFDNGDFEGFGFGHVKANRDIYVGARVGARVGPEMLLYAKGGYTNAKFDLLSSDGTTELRQDLDADGWRIGAGGEYALSERTFAKLEYRYSNYNKGEVDFDGGIPDSERFDMDLDRHQVVAGVGMRF
jgi:outer membrane immunogenic protein